MCENGCGLWPWQEPLFWLSLFSTLWDFLQCPSAPVERGVGKGREQPNKLPSPSETRLSLTLAEKWHFPLGQGEVLAQASDADRGEHAGSSSQPVPSSSSSLPRQLGTVGVKGCDYWPGQSRGELRLAAFHSLTGSSVFYKSPNVTGNG